MATVKAFGKQDSPDTISVKIKLSHGQQRKQIKLFNVPLKDWDKRREKVKKSHPEYYSLNLKISAEVEKYEVNIRELELAHGKDFTMDDIIDHTSKNVLLSTVIDNYAKALHYKNARKYKNLKGKILNYRDINVHKVDVNYIRGFIRSLEQDPAINSQGTIHRYFNFLKTALRSVDFNKNKVLKYEVSKGQVNRDILTVDEFLRFSACEKYILSRDAFQLCLFTRGSRIGDVLQLQKSDIKNGRFEFKEQKTQKFKSTSINIGAMEIVKRWEDKSEFGYVLPIIKRPWKNPKVDHKFQKHIETRTAVVNRELKKIANEVGIDKNLHTHIARHTYVHWADYAGLDSRVIKKMLNFSSLKMMENYMHDLRKNDELDNAADSIFDKLG